MLATAQIAKVNPHLDGEPIRSQERGRICGSFRLSQSAS
jgi:hypothetical protein